MRRFVLGLVLGTLGGSISVVDPSPRIEAAEAIVELTFATVASTVVDLEREVDLARAGLEAAIEVCGVRTGYSPEGGASRLR